MFRTPDPNKGGKGDAPKTQDSGKEDSRKEAPELPDGAVGGQPEPQKDREPDQVGADGENKRITTRSKENKQSQVWDSQVEAFVSPDKVIFDPIKMARDLKEEGLRSGRKTFTKKEEVASKTTTEDKQVKDPKKGQRPPDRPVQRSLADLLVGSNTHKDNGQAVAEARRQRNQKLINEALLLNQEQRPSTTGNPFVELPKKEQKGQKGQVVPALDVDAERDAIERNLLASQNLRNHTDAFTQQVDSAQEQEEFDKLDMLQRRQRGLEEETTQICLIRAESWKHRGQIEASKKLMDDYQYLIAALDYTRDTLEALGRERAQVETLKELYRDTRQHRIDQGHPEPMEELEHFMATLEKSKETKKRDSAQATTGTENPWRMNLAAGRADDKGRIVIQGDSPHHKPTTTKPRRDSAWPQEDYPSPPGTGRSRRPSRYEFDSEEMLLSPFSREYLRRKRMKSNPGCNRKRQEYPSQSFTT